MVVDNNNKKSNIYSMRIVFFFCQSCIKTVFKKCRQCDDGRHDSFQEASGSMDFFKIANLQSIIVDEINKAERKYLYVLLFYRLLNYNYELFFFVIGEIFFLF